MNSKTRPSSFARVAAVLILSAPLAGCPVWGDPPPDAQLSCASRDDCPLGWECLPSGRCLSTTGDVGEPPRIVALAVTPAAPSRSGPSWVRAGASVTVAITTDVSVIVDQVALTHADGQLTLQLDNDASDPSVPRYVFATGVTGNEAQGTYSLSVSLLSEQGARLFDPAAASVALDFGSPRSWAAARSPRGPCAAGMRCPSTWPSTSRPPSP